MRKIRWIGKCNKDLWARISDKNHTKPTIQIRTIILSKHKSQDKIQSTEWV